MKEIIKGVSEEFGIARPEAELIIASLLEQPRFEVYLNRKIDDDKATLLKMKLKQLKNGVPIEYITKRVHFLDYSLKIYPGVFIPRQETEYFVELIKKTFKFSPQRILEIGTGCGAIAIGLSWAFPKAKIIATDISGLAIHNAKENIEALGLSTQINLLRTDIFDGINAKFDLIVSNPPYISSEWLRFLPKSVRDFEPIKAINGGRKGVQFIKKLVELGFEHLAHNGAVAIEIDEDEVSILRHYLTTPLENAPCFRTEFLTRFAFKKDLFDRIRYLFIGNIER